MKTIEKRLVAEINKLHGKILNSLKMSLGKGIRIGELLAEQKENLKHGEFTAWVNCNLPFTDRTARNYMRLFQERDRLKTENVSVLKDAYELLIEHKEEGCFGKMERAVSLLQEAKGYELTDEEFIETIGNDDSNASKKLIVWDAIFLQTNHLISEISLSWEEELQTIKDIEEAYKYYNVAKKCASLSSARGIYTEMNLGRCLNELKKRGVPEWAWTKKGGYDKLIKMCEAEIARLMV